MINFPHRPLYPGPAPNVRAGAGRDPTHYRRHPILTIIATIALMLSIPCRADGIFDGADYELGRGFRVPRLNLTLSGYVSLQLQNLATSETQFNMRDLSLITIWDPHPRWRFFSEMELENTFGIDDRGLNASDTEAELERLYIDYTINDAAIVRTGKYLTPFGRWNELHADPLVWTVNRPLVTTLAVPDHGSGLTVHGQIPIQANGIEYHVYVDDSDDFDPHHGDSSFENLKVPGLSNDFNNAIGAQLRYHFLNDQAEIGASFANFEIYDVDGRQNMLGLDALYRWRRAEFSMESAYRISDSASDDHEWGTFVQAVLPLVWHWYTVARIEFYSSDVVGRDTHQTTLGLAYRPVAATTFKLEYHDGSDSELTPDGWEASWSILF